MPTPHTPATYPLPSPRTPATYPRVAPTPPATYPLAHTHTPATYPLLAPRTPATYPLVAPRAPATYPLLAPRTPATYPSPPHRTPATYLLPAPARLLVEGEAPCAVHSCVRIAVCSHWRLSGQGAIANSNLTARASTPQTNSDAISRHPKNPPDCFRYSAPSKRGLPCVLRCVRNNRRCRNFCLPRAPPDPPAWILGCSRPPALD